VTSIVSDGGLAGGTISVGTGFSGAFQWISMNTSILQSPPIGYQVIIGGTITYSVCQTLIGIKASNPNGTVTNNPGYQFLFGTSTAALTANNTGYTIAPISAATIQVTASNNTGTLTGTFLQAGVR
jgi:hypothetical protein